MVGRTGDASPLSPAVATPLIHFIMLGCVVSTFLYKYDDDDTDTQTDARDHTTFLVVFDSREM